MIKAFLSHSSKDKDSYIRPVANWLGKDNIIYDEFTFEEGEKTLEQIVSGLNDSELFVLFISESSLESTWVKEEITRSKKLNEDGMIKKIYPIIIDENITHEDKRIPEWLRDNYNLQLVKRARVAAKRIKNHLYKISWSKHPILEKKSTLFVGRNDKLEEFEERIDNFEKNKPTVIFATGLNGVGRRTFLSRALNKVNITKNITTPHAIYLDRNESIEDFILKLNDLGLVDFKDNLLSLSDKSTQEKQDIVKKILTEAYNAKEVIFLLDDGCLINYKREMTHWFKETITSCNEFSYPVICCASRYRVNFVNRPRNSDKFHFVELNELSDKERKRLLVRLLEIEDIACDKNNFSSISELLTGLPEQVKFAVELIKDNSIIPFENKLPILSEFNNDKASILIQRYSHDEEILDFIRLLAQFEVITLDFIFSIVDRVKYSPILEDLNTESICDFVGSDGEMVRLNDIIRDYIKRNRLQVNVSHMAKIDTLVRKTLEKDDIQEEDSSVYIFTIKEMLKSDEPIDPKYLIPSHYLRCMKDLYNTKGSLDKVISLADIILQKERNMEANVVQDIRYYLCLALAKKSDSRLLREVQKIRGDEHHFLLGFYYRKCGRLSDALDKFKSIIDAPYVESRVKREIVQVYTQLDDYEKAISYAKKNYEENRSNQFHCQAYFDCLINSQDTNRTKQSTLLEIISSLKKINSEQSNQIARISEASYTAKILDDKSKAFDIINDCIEAFNDSHYPLLTKCDIALKYRESEILESTLSQLERMKKGKQISDRTLIKHKAFLLALQGKEADAINLITKEVSRYPQENREKILKRIKDLSLSN